MALDFAKIEAKWQKAWEDKKIFSVKEDTKKKKFYNLEMFPYPSGEGIHMGHTRNYSLGDCISRFKRMQGYNVLYPMGWDAFGLPAENAAIKRKVHPEDWTRKNISLMKSQMKKLGISYDWSREFATCDDDYYGWNQWIFLQFYKKGLVYKDKSEVNWCPTDMTVLADEQVIDGKCWRCHSVVEPKLLEQWFFKITKYAEELLQDLKKLDWPERVLVQQKNWIGKSEGAEIDFPIADSKKKLTVFTTRLDTIHGCTFLVMAPEHPLVLELVAKTKYEKPAKEFIERLKRIGIKERTEEKEKHGLFIGKHAINPFTNEEIPIYIANFVLMEYGTGIVMAVPAHDARDFEFAQKYKLPIKFVIKPKAGKLDKNIAFVEDGILFDSGKFSSLESSKAREDMAEFASSKKFGRKTIHYRLRDWLISRQRYWGTPIPIIYCGKCGIVPVNEKDLPVKLPRKVTFGKGNPLSTNEEFVKTTCPKCKSPARRETDTMDTFVDSSWYYLRYTNNKFAKGPFDTNAVKYWMPVDQYIGGIEHAILHLLYARFFTKALRDMGLLKIDEPFMRLLSQGMLTLGGYAMSKSRGNVVDPLEMIRKYSADATRTVILFAALPDKDVEWSDKSMEGVQKFLYKVYALSQLKVSGNGSKDNLILSKMQRTISKVTEDIENYRFNFAIQSLMEFTNLLDKHTDNISAKTHKESIRKLTLLLAPFAPHITEEIWHSLGNKDFVSTAAWPSADKKLIDEAAEKAEETVEKVIEDIRQVVKLTGKTPKKIYLYAIPKELEQFRSAEKSLGEKFSALVKAFAVNDPKKVDPQSKASKAKPGKPGIYIE